jgi:thiamine pyrophosphate-dependent acetolactate synthase large subunit-like protein
MSKSMPLVSALHVLRELRTDEIVVTTMGTAREWPRLSSHALDFHFVPSAMGQAPTLALGLALAQPQRKVIAFNGDGSMLMNLGCLTTIAASGAQNFTLVVFDNGIYEVTGGQQTAAAVAHVDFAGVGRASGIPSAVSFDDLAAWQQGARDALALPGPRLIVLKVQPVGDNYHLDAPGPIVQRLAQFRAALAS